MGIKVYFAADHAGFELKNDLASFLSSDLSMEIEDCGAFEQNTADDYPLIIANAARKLSEDAQNNIESYAILIGASGQGEAIVANRFTGVRCALYYGEAKKTQTDTSGHILDIIVSTRAHNNANALSLGARFITKAEAREVVQRWLSTPFSNDERHSRRIAQIDTVV